MGETPTGRTKVETLSAIRTAGVTKYTDGISTHEAGVTKYTDGISTHEAGVTKCTHGIATCTTCKKALHFTGSPYGAWLINFLLTTTNR